MSRKVLADWRCQLHKSKECIILLSLVNLSFVGRNIRETWPCSTSYFMMVGSSAQCSYYFGGFYAVSLTFLLAVTHNSIFLNDFGSWKIWSEEKKPEANFFGSEGFNSTQLFWILKTQKMLAEGFFFLNSKFWSWKGVQNELFLYWITFLPCSYEAKVKNKNLYFPREIMLLFNLAQWNFGIKP